MKVIVAYSHFDPEKTKADNYFIQKRKKRSINSPTALIFMFYILIYG